MIITFCGNRELTNKNNLIYFLLKTLTDLTNAEEEISFYLGGSGDFDYVALKSCVEFKKTHKKCTMCFITPYLNSVYIKNKLESKLCDKIIYPEIEKTPLRFAIIERNRWMVKKADVVISYIEHSFGGAYKTLQYAIQKKKIIIDLYEKNKK